MVKKKKYLDLSELETAAAAQSYKTEGNLSLPKTKDDLLNQVIEDINTGYNREKKYFDSMLAEISFFESVLNIGYWNMVVTNDNFYDLNNIIVIDPDFKKRLSSKRK